MNYFVTGATGFIGRHLVEHLLARGGSVYALTRPGSRERLDSLRARWGAGPHQVMAVEGDLSRPRLGVADETLARLRGRLHHCFHLAAVYDMAADAEALFAANVEGTRNLLSFVRAVEPDRLHHMSSIAVAGRYPGVFREDMFEEAADFGDDYSRSKHASEALVRSECPVPWRVYRPGVVVGHSRSGQMDKIDGPYYFFKLIQRLRGALPPWLPLVGIQGGEANLVPVDFVAAALDHLAHAPDLDGRAFHLVDPKPRHAGEALNVFARAAHAPEFAMRLDAKVADVVPPALRSAFSNLPPVRRITDQVLADLGIPRPVLGFLETPTRFDCRETVRALEGSGIAVPPLEEYAPRLWDYWERHLDPDLFRERSLAAAVGGRRVLVTGASSGIGRAVALQLAGAGAIVILVARNADKLRGVQREVEKRGGTAHVHSADLSDLESCEALVAEVVVQHGGVDVLVNNAGRSIRRSLALSQDRFHDFQRTMQLNYFGALKMILGFLPGMRERRSGHIVNVSSIGVQTSPPRFSAYVASKAALDAFSRCVASELIDEGVDITTIHMPLVRTEMIAPTTIYRAFPTISPQEAAEFVCNAMIDRPKRVSTRLGVFGQVAYAVAPKAVDALLATAYRLFPDSAAARGEKERPGDAEMSTEAIAFAHMVPGVHW
jgi:NAD(P)-dependent dehydrogenase (short-subunit alcohol dehydrogenase family)